MPKIDATIIKAIKDAINMLGSQSAVARKAGITQSALCRYINQQVQSINASTWNALFPVIKDYLPEEYHRAFLDWKTPEEWKEYAKKYPVAYKNIIDEVAGIDIKKDLKNNPLFGASQQKLQTIEMIKELLPYGYLDTLREILQQLWADETKYKTACEEENKKSSKEHLKK